MAALNARYQALERQSASAEEQATARVLAALRAALTPEQNEMLASWLKGSSPVNVDLASAFESCALADPSPLAEETRRGRPPLVANGDLFGGLTGLHSGPSTLLAAASSVPPTSLLVPTDSHSPGVGGVGGGAGGEGGLPAPGSAPIGPFSRVSPSDLYAHHAMSTGLPRGTRTSLPGSGPAESTGPIAIPGIAVNSFPSTRAAASVPNGHSPMDRSSDDEGAGFLGAGSSAGAFGPRSMDDLESAHAILSLTSGTPPAPAGSAPVGASFQPGRASGPVAGQGGDLQFQ